jgi:hypothetical protein
MHVRGCRELVEAKSTFYLFVTHPPTAYLVHASCYIANVRTGNNLK